MQRKLESPRKKKKKECMQFMGIIVIDSNDNT